MFLGYLWAEFPQVTIHLPAIPNQFGCNSSKIQSDGHLFAVAKSPMKPTGLLQLSYAGKTGKAEPPSLQQQPPSPVHTAPELSPPYGKFLILLRLGGGAGNDGKREWAGASLLSFPFPAFPPRCRFFPLPRPTAKKPLRSKQHERGLCGGERFQKITLKYIVIKNLHSPKEPDIITYALLFSI